MQVSNLHATPVCCWLAFSWVQRLCMLITQCSLQPHLPKLENRISMRCGMHNSLPAS